MDTPGRIFYPDSDEAGTYALVMEVAFEADNDDEAAAFAEAVREQVEAYHDGDCDVRFVVKKEVGGGTVTVDPMTEDYQA